MKPVKIKTTYACQECGVPSPKWQGQCTACGKWNCIVEEIIHPAPSYMSNYTTQKNILNKPIVLNENEIRHSQGISTGMNELDRVLGGRLVPGSYTLLGGAPGIGKSTLLLQMAEGLSQQNKKVLYISAEESVQQTKLRAQRLSIKGTQIYILNETFLDKIFQHIETLKPDVLIVDSIQTVQLAELQSAPGTVSQVRECAGQLMNMAKNTQTAVFIIGHITKDGQLAGPRLLEHTVDTVLSFDGDPHYHFRILRTLKNRFGPTNEIGVFQMSGDGLKEVKNPSEYFLEERGAQCIGSVVFTAIEGSRPVLCEIQALVLKSYLSIPRRTALGLDINRLHKIIAVLDSYLKTNLAQYDVFLNVVGGLKVTEPGIDLAMAKALVSAKKQQPIGQDSCFFGELGLTGEIRACTFSEERVKEAEKLGFKNIYLPLGNKKHLNKKPGNKNLHFISSITELISPVFNRK